MSRRRCELTLTAAAGLSVGLLIGWPSDRTYLHVVLVVLSFWLGVTLMWVLTSGEG